MTNISVFASVVISLTILMAGCVSPAGQGLNLGDPASVGSASPAASLSQGSALELVAEPLKHTVKLGEPVYLALHVTNAGNEPVRLVGSLRPGEGLVEVSAAYEQGKSITLAPLTESDFENTVLLESGQTIGNTFPIFFGANGWNFKAPGKYQISVRLLVPTDGKFIYFDSKAVDLYVTAAESGKLLFAADQRTLIESGKFLLWRTGDHLESGIKHLQMVSDKYPRSSIASYNSAALANNLSEPFTNYLVGEVRVPNCSMADEYRKQINYDLLPTNLLVEDSISRAKCHAEKANWKGTRSALNRGSKLVGDRSEFSGYFKSIEEMKRNLERHISN
ncbi:hypothetical protein [Neptunomonas qingdaonensis]|uniref:Uncharacterized protein n=1 Tax=Neptunomonas qingdaonensis TaxID=1045558 RepID=A0A1I2QUS9_9GAMM|nr:hypothetical protein [Neptunomonas qingdaonensis]SFG31019.1 hypothetical protein SAMN05216175_105102 [Neptunomonas qingdaonensis]